MGPIGFSGDLEVGQDNGAMKGLFKIRKNTTLLTNFGFLGQNIVVLFNTDLHFEDSKFQQGLGFGLELVH